MSRNKEQIATAIAASAALYAGTLCLNPGVAAFVFGVGGDLISNILQWGARAVSGRVGKKWLVNPDIRNALKQAYKHALEQLERDYRKDYPPSPGRDEGRVIKDVFAELLNGFDTLFAEAENEGNIRDLVGANANEARNNLSQHIELFIHDEDKLLAGYMRDRFADELARFFIEELKTNDKARNAIQLLFLAELESGIEELKHDSKGAQVLLTELVLWKRQLETNPRGSESSLITALGNIEDTVRKIINEQTVELKGFIDERTGTIFEKIAQLGVDRQTGLRRTSTLSIVDEIRTLRELARSHHLIEHIADSKTVQISHYPTAIKLSESTPRQINRGDVSLRSMGKDSTYEFSNDIYALALTYQQGLEKATFEVTLSDGTIHRVSGVSFLPDSDFFGLIALQPIDSLTISTRGTFYISNFYFYAKSQHARHFR
ncbi:MAG TPA: hypothetical protein VJ183_16405 [Chloroflexia bacterium]|nr:hypothetical protein [Chloroflexia bacterium]